MNEAANEKERRLFADRISGTALRHGLPSFHNNCGNPGRKGRRRWYTSRVGYSMYLSGLKKTMVRKGVFLTRKETSVNSFER